MTTTNTTSGICQKWEYNTQPNNTGEKLKRWNKIIKKNGVTIHKMSTLKTAKWFAVLEKGREQEEKRENVIPKPKNTKQGLMSWMQDLLRKH